MIDLLLRATAEGFTVDESDGVFVLTAGIQTGVVLSIAGGAQADAAREDTAHVQFWLNRVLPEPSRLRSRTLHLLYTLPATSGNLRKIESAAAEDLGWLLADGYVSDIAVAASIAAHRRVKIAITTPEGSLAVTAPWEG